MSSCILQEIHAFPMTTAFKAPTIFRNNILKKSVTPYNLMDKKIAASKARIQRPKMPQPKAIGGRC